MLQQLNVVDDSCESTLVLKRNWQIFWAQVMTFQFFRDTVIFLLTYVK